MEHLRRYRFTGARRTSIAGTRSSIYYIYDLPFWRDQDNADAEPPRRLADLGRDVHAHRHAVLDRPTNDIAGVGDGGFGQPYNLSAIPRRVRTGNSPTGSDRTATSGSIPPRSRRRRRARSAMAAQPIYNPGQVQWDIALFKNFRLGGDPQLQFRAEFFNFLNHPNLGGGGRPDGCTMVRQNQSFSPVVLGAVDPMWTRTSARITTKTEHRRDIQAQSEVPVLITAKSIGDWRLTIDCRLMIGV